MVNFVFKLFLIYVKFICKKKKKTVKPSLSKIIEYWKNIDQLKMFQEKKNKKKKFRSKV